MRAVMYHYVREYDSELPNFRFLDVRNFRQQLDFFARQYGFVTRDEWLAFVEHGALPETAGKVLLTFDDAMYCHYDYVYPELRKRSLWGIFYVPTLPYLSGKMLDVHRIHLLCGAFDGNKLMSIASTLVTEDMIPFEKREEFRTQTYTRQVNYEGVTEFKRLLNYFISYDYRSDIIDRLAAELGFSFDTARFYVSRDQLTAMSRNGMVIGSHTNSHPVMSKLTYEEQKAELVTSFDFIAQVSDGSPKTYCHPYGGFHSFNQDTINLLDQMAVAYSFNVEERQIEPADRVKSKQHLPRFDCNLFPHGKAS